jgi:glycosyltransferase involved in cell wall biosynthesis
MPAILQRYTLVLEPSWSGYANLQLLAYTRFAEHRVLVMATCPEDHEFLARLGSNLVPIPLGASDWVDPRIFRPLPGVEKDFDTIFVARWSLAKRHRVLLDAVRRIGDPGYRVAIAAGFTPTGNDEQEIRELIRSSPVARQVTVFDPRPQSELNLLLNRSRVNVVLSRQEGSNRSLFEGFFAGVPGIALKSNLGISKSHFTPTTGELIGDDDLATALLHFRAHGRDYAPRPWALANIAPEVSARKLNAALRELAEERGEAWTRDIVAKCNAPNLAYYPDASVGAAWEGAEGLMVSSPARGLGEAAGGSPG